MDHPVPGEISIICKVLQLTLKNNVVCHFFNYGVVILLLIFIQWWANEHALLNANNIYTKAGMSRQVLNFKQLLQYTQICTNGCIELKESFKTWLDSGRQWNNNIAMDGLIAFSNFFQTTFDEKLLNFTTLIRE